jgi:protein-tyrosine-phosphatase
MPRITRLLAAALCWLAASCAESPPAVDPGSTQVLFVCEHGNVKSLMAASYFNQLSHARGLPFRAVSRGSAPDSDAAPEFVRRRLAGEGFDVSGFRPEAVTAADLAASQVVVTIGTEAPANTASTPALEQWDDIPPASSDYGRASAALRSRVAELLERLERDSPR